MDWRTVFQDFENLENEQKLELFRAIRNALFPDTPQPLAALVGELREVCEAQRKVSFPPALLVSWMREDFQ
jgi:hypothetical protein